MKITLLLLLLSSTLVHADPQLTSWFTTGSSKYARLVETDAELLAGVGKTTWTRTSGPNTTTQATPAYAGPQQIDSSANWVYLKTPDLGPYMMGPWYDNAAKSALFVNIPKNQNLTVRFPRTSTLGTIPTTKTGTAGLNVGGVMQDAVGFFIDGVALFDPMDGFSYASGTETSPGTGQWHRDALINEAITFDKGFSHQQNTGKYHNHANPYALRYLLGDNVTFNNTTKIYAEGNPASPAKHSPILGWMLDGLPLYGPYAYSNALDASSGVRRMVGGFVKRDGTTTGVDNIATAGRTVPAWALRNGATQVAGPAVSTTYPSSRYIEDNAYLGDLIKSGSTKYALGTDFDLNEYNVRYCVTPEFPNGTWAYFLNITSAGAPQFPYMINRWFYGTPTGGSLTTVGETVTNVFKGGPNLTEVPSIKSMNQATGDITLTWSSVEGGTYKVDASNDLTSWTTLAAAKAATANSSTTEILENTAATRRFYKIARASLAAYDGGSAVTYSAPAATTVAAGSVAVTTATVNGTVIAYGSNTTVSFDYGLTTAYGNSVSAAQSPLSTNAATSVSAALTGLVASSTYHFRVKAVNTLGTTYGNDLVFTTLALGTQLPPTATTSAATLITSTTATLNAVVNANGATSNCSFEYGITTAYGTVGSSTPVNVTGNADTSILLALTNLVVGTTYHFRVKSTNTGGTSYGLDQTFTTTSVAAEGITSVTPNTGTRGTAVTLTVVLNNGYTVPPPPTTVAPTGASLTRAGATTINATTFTRNTTTGVVTLGFTLPAGATLGSYTVNVVFGPNTWSLTNGFTVN